MRQCESDPRAVWVLPDEPVPVRLMNTIWADRHGVHDALTQPAHLADWLNEIGVCDHGHAVIEEDLALARHLRDALRRLAALRTGDTRPGAVSPTEDPAAAVQVVNQMAAALVPPRLNLDGNAMAVDDTPPGHPAALADVAIEAIALLTDTAVAPLQACFAPGCVLYFVKDHPRKEWCSNACGNRARAARHYRRHRNPYASVVPARSSK